ncbi:MAG: DUF3168 domain-containing protein [Beijerinckiaceae bacterium]
MSFSTSVLTGVYAALSSDATLQGLLANPARSATPAPVYPVQAAPDVALPYVTFNEVAGVAFDTSDSFGREHTIDIHAWSGAASPKEAYDILGRVETVLQDAALSVTQGDLILIRLASVRCDVDGDGTYHGVATFRALVSE